MNELNDELAQFARAVVQGGGISPRIDTDYPDYTLKTALEVYRNNYRGNLHDALAGAYPVIVQLVGEDFFRYMARRYIDQYPSQSANLHHYGDRLADFLAEFEPAQELAYLADIAKLEWACQQAYLAYDQAPLELEALAQIPPERYPELVLYTDCRLIRSDYPIAAIWHAHQHGERDFQIDLDSGPSIVRVRRIDDGLRVDELSAAQAHWLQCIQEKQTLGTATDATLQRYPEFDLQAALLDAQLTGFSGSEAVRREAD